MVATVAEFAAVSTLDTCTYCPAETSFACLNCAAPICPDCVPADYCPACDTPDPFAHMVASSGPALADLPLDLYLLATEHAPSACQFCGAPIYRGDNDATGTRHARCARFLTALDARRQSWKEDAIAIAA